MFLIFFFFLLFFFLEKIKQQKSLDTCMFLIYKLIYHNLWGGIWVGGNKGFAFGNFWRGIWANGIYEGLALKL